MKGNMFDMSSIRNLKKKQEKRYLLGSFIVSGDTLFCFQPVMPLHLRNLLTNTLLFSAFS